MNGTMVPESVWMLLMRSMASPTSGASSLAGVLAPALLSFFSKNFSRLATCFL